jgi:hypothetical protein
VVLSHSFRQGQELSQQQWDKEVPGEAFVRLRLRLQSQAELGHSQIGWKEFVALCHSCGLQRDCAEPKLRAKLLARLREQQVVFHAAKE